MALAGEVVVAGAGVDAMLTGAPATSVTAGTFANGSVAVVEAAPEDAFAGVSEYESLTTGMRVLMLLLPTWSAGAAGATTGAACSFGTASWANET